MNISSVLLTGQMTTGGATRFSQTSTNLKINGFMVDVRFTVPASYTSKWDFLKNIYLTITERLGETSQGGTVPLVSDVDLFSFLSYSDFLAGVSMNSTTFTEGSEVRISGYVPIGFFAMGARDALEVLLNVNGSLPASVDFTVSAIYQNLQLTSYRMYKTSKPTGADQPYNNVLGIYYVGKGFNQNATVIDQLGTKTVNVNDAVALSNSQGRFEFFTDFGEIYADEFGISQNVSLRLPPNSGDTSAVCLIEQYGFYPNVLESNASDLNAERNALIEKIKVTDNDKYSYLEKLGIVNEG